MKSLNASFPLSLAFLGWRPLAFYGLVVLAGWLTNFWRGEAVYLLVACSLLLPLVEREAVDWGRCLAWRREGWGWSLALTGLAIGGGLGLLVTARALQGAATEFPQSGFVLKVVATSLALWIPLAMAEEFFFRGYLQESVGSRLLGGQRIGARWVSLSLKNLWASALFGLAHALAQASLYGLAMFVSGLLFGAIVERSRGSIWPAVLLHAGLNSAGLLAWRLLELNYPLLAAYSQVG